MSSPQNNITAIIMPIDNQKQSTSTTSLPGSCEACGEPAKLTCTGCKLDPGEPNDETRKTYYCSTECQRAHWAQHKVICKSHVDRIALYRAAEIASKVFLNFCRKSWGRKVGSVTDEGRVLRVEIHELPQDAVYWPVPDLLGHPIKDLYSVLSYSQCGNSMAGMWDAVQLLFKGEDVQFEEIMAQVEDCPRETCLILPDGVIKNAMGPVHLFWHLVDKKQKSYALDLAAHQFGHHESLTPVSTYRTKLTLDVWGKFPGGEEKQRQLDQETLHEHLAARMLVRQGAATANTILTWESNNMSIRQLLRLPEAEFTHKSADLIQLCDDCVTRAVDQHHQLALEIRRSAP